MKTSTGPGAGRDRVRRLVNAAAFGEGMRVFGSRRLLKQTASTAYASGIVINTYEPQ
jgi:hypothetical protein